jgi:hypothetical protein
MWEYLIVTLARDEAELQSAFAGLGHQGWQLTQIIDVKPNGDVFCFFQRPWREPTPPVVMPAESKFETT